MISREELDKLAERIRTTFSQLGFDARVVDATDRTRAGSTVVSEDEIVLTILEDDGVLLLSSEATRRAAKRATTSRSQPLRTFVVPRLRRSHLSGLLQKLDRKLAPQPGLWRWCDGNWILDTGEPSAGRTLLIVHGTFSSGRDVIGDMTASQSGMDFLDVATNLYERILVFEHGTLASSAVLDACILAESMDHLRGDIDVVCHSRGGLIVRWWLENIRGIRPGNFNVVFVGAPLHGTNLAAPQKLLHTLSYLLNLHVVLASDTNPSDGFHFMDVGLAVAQIAASIPGAGSRELALDAIVALVPGLQSQARYENNIELEILRADTTRSGNCYYAITADFRPPPIGWRFWHYFNRSQIVSRGADCVFEGPNDLVVDTDSMTSLDNEIRIQAENCLFFGKDTGIHHLNYFSCSETFRFIRRSLGWSQ